ncbi:hypothetical protein IU453_27705 [Nocardia cyriacigeorgica]|uniref:hypothetical protein n=1 Tax=Nocardia cyriacigeorgica TaxID=135487 RepID=UPI001894531A|nr:hypothetical protein [Nocardia cyriacigeorgica]MBF6320535.1 hypothetical protein [Nocardia cyriacigeorgica]MBF6346298.1 hypothetical protein [Nocardia cyriacigeorgica]MBF6535022.1 hypothetical protein [Nocardia cyriacigeorgica]
MASDVVAGIVEFKVPQRGELAHDPTRSGRKRLQDYVLDCIEPAARVKSVGVSRYNTPTATGRWARRASTVAAGPTNI